MKKDSSVKKAGAKGILSRFRRAEGGAITLEIAIAMSFLGFGFVGLLSTVTSIDNANAGEQALNDMVLTVRALPSIDERSDEQLKLLFGEIAGDNLRSSQRADVTVSRNCGCPLENIYNEQLCQVPTCADGLEPGKFLDIALLVKPHGTSTDSDVIDTFNYSASVQYAN